MIGQYLIDLVDDSGYLSGDLAATAEKLGTGVAEVEAVLAVLQTLRFQLAASAPAISLAGVMIQLKENDRYELGDAGADLAARLCWPSATFVALKKICSVGDEDLADMIAEVRRLNPKPGHAFGSAVVQPIVPDVFVRPAPDGASIVGTQLRHAAGKFWSTRATIRRFRRPPAAIPTNPISPSACRAPRGSYARSISAREPSSRSRTKSSASRIRSSCPRRRKSPASAQSENRRRGDQHARSSCCAQVPRHRQQIHGDQPRHLRAQIFLYLGDRGVRTVARRIQRNQCVTASSN